MKPKLCFCLDQFIMGGVEKTAMVVLPELKKQYDISLIVESEIDCKEQMHRKNGFIYSKVNETELQKGKKYYLLTEERAEDDYFCGSDTVQYFSKEIRFLCGVSLVENIRKEMYTYVGVDMEIKNNRGENYERTNF